MSRKVKRRELVTLAAPERMICQGSVRSICRMGMRPKNNPLKMASSSASDVSPGIRIDRDIDRDVGNRPPRAEHTQNRDRRRHPADAPGHRYQKRFREHLAQDQLAARSQSDPDGNLARPVCCARREEAAKIGAGSQQDEAGKQHEPGHEGACGPAEGVSGEPGMRQGKLQTVVCLGIRFGQRIGNRIQVGRGCFGSDIWPQTADDPCGVIAAFFQKVTFARPEACSQSEPRNPGQRKAPYRGNRQARRQ